MGAAGAAAAGIAFERCCVAKDCKEARYLEYYVCFSHFYAYLKDTRILVELHKKYDITKK